MNELNQWMSDKDDNINLFYPNVPIKAIEMVSSVLNSRWIGQGPGVDKFEIEFAKLIECENVIAVGSGTDALHLAYILAGIEEGDEVLTPVFTCTATNLPLLYIGAIPVFLDIDPLTMNISVEDIEKNITPKTKAIVTVDYGGLPCEYEKIMLIADKYGLKVIDDAAHAVGAQYKNKKIGSIADFTAFSFQAIKHITTGDGGLLSIKDSSLIDLAKRIRWFGIDRKAKQGGIWANDIKEIGYKYQMTDIGAAMGLAGLQNFDKTLKHRMNILNIYMDQLNGIDGLFNVGSKNLEGKVHAAWLHTILVKEREMLQSKLRSKNIESAPVHYRNDKYTIFSNYSRALPNMDKIEKEYLVLPLHMRVSEDNALKICREIKNGW